MATENCSDDGLSQSVIFDHYSKIADKYDQFYGSHFRFQADAAIRHLRLRPDDRLVDVGGGTGGVAWTIWIRAGLKCSPLVADPNPNLLAKAEEKGLETLLTSADAFFSAPSSPSYPPADYNKFLFCHCLQHFPDWRATFAKVLAVVLPGSVCLIIADDHGDLTIPLFEAALEKKSLRPKGDNLHLGLAQIGFDVDEQEGKTLYSCTKEEWYKRIRGRSDSILEHFTDEEIEAGIAELERTKLKNVDIVEYENKFKFLVATKM